MKGAPQQPELEARSSIFNESDPVLGSHPLVHSWLNMPTFGDPHYWSLAAADMTPNSSIGKTGIDFRKFLGEWNLRAREIAMISLNPNHPQLVLKGLSGARKLPKVSTVMNVVQSLGAIYVWAVDTDAPMDLELWTPAHARDFLESSLSQRSPSTVHTEVGVLRMLYTYRNALTNGGIRVPPWPTHLSNARIAGYRAGGELKTEPLSPEEWAAVVNAAWTYVDKFEPDIRLARERYLVPRGESAMTTAQARELVRRWLAADSARIPLYESSDSIMSFKGEINYQRILVEATGCRWKLAKQLIGGDLRKQIEELAESGLTTGAFSVAYRIESSSGEELPWRTPMESRRDIESEDVRLRTACYILISALTLMRDSEIQGIRKNAVTNHYGSPAIRSKVIKQNWTQEDRHWWAADPVLKAIEVLERQHQGPWLFGVFKNSVPGRQSQPPRLAIFADIRNFIEHLNENHGHWNLDPVETAVNARRLRRTMAIIAGTAIDGPVAVALQLKHATRFAIANQLSSSYSAPDARWMEALTQSQRQATAGFLKDLSEKALEDPELRPSGPGAHRALAAGENIANAVFPGVVDDGTISKIVSEDGVGTLQEGPISYCLGDPSVALCLSTEEKARGDAPNPVMCRPDRCTNSFVTSKQRAQLERQLHELKDRLRKSSSPTAVTVLKDRVSEIERLIEEGPEYESGDS